jgi:hypothetical protein
MQALIPLLLFLGPFQATAAKMEADDALFLKLTIDANRAIQAKDTGALDKALAKDFAFSLFVEGKAPQVMNRNETLKAVGALYTLERFEIRNLAARVFGSTAVVRFQPYREAELGSKDRTGEFAVVDVWLKEGDGWRLASRYQGRPDPGLSTR